MQISYAASSPPTDPRGLRHIPRPPHHLARQCARHLAIGNHWKVHHDSTDMDEHVWMQDEEAAFLADPTSVFTSANYETLRTIQAAIDLEHFGIDCSLDLHGDVVVFEVNASMLVHNDNRKFPYKSTYVQHVKQAFDAMLHKVAAR